MSKIKVDQLEGSTGSTITVPTGQTLTITDGLAASTITSGTIADARIPNLNASKINAGALAVAQGGTGLTSLGSAGQVIKVASGGSALEFAAEAGGGKVLQVVAASSETNVNSSSTSFVNTGGLPSFSFTPAATSSKVLLLANFGALELTGSNAYWNIYRDSSSLGNSTAGFTQTQYSSSHRFASGGAVYLDSPNTTSAVTYQIRIKVSGDSCNFGEGCSVNLVAMEIGA